MRSGLGFPVSHGNGRVTLGFENSAVYQDAGDAFEAAQRSLVATAPGAVFRYINSGLNVLAQSSGTRSNGEGCRTTKRRTGSWSTGSAWRVTSIPPISRAI
jgi:hypothetical protein